MTTFLFRGLVNKPPDYANIPVLPLYPPPNMKSVSLLTYVMTLITAVLVIVEAFYYITPNSIAFAQTQPNLNATSIYDSGQMVLGSNVKHLVIAIPNEGHHGPGEEDEARFIAQPFLPQDAIVGPGTQVAWFNGDVGHEHNIVVRDANGAQLFETGEFDELETSRPLMFNTTGDYEYADAVEYEEGFVMTGTIRVVDQDTATPTPTSAPAATFDTVGALMVPSMDVQSATANIEDAGLRIDSMHNFKDLRGGQSDTGDEQTLVIWTANGMNLHEIGSRLQAISEPLPYE
jgi:plastocyanin